VWRLSAQPHRESDMGGPFSEEPKRMMIDSLEVDIYSQID
jgi:hypothetical protein